VAKLLDPASRIFGGECNVSYAGHGSVHAEFMLKNGIHGLDGWACQAGDPPLLLNPGTAQASILTCNVTAGRKK
jgi:hypothetical protein